MTKTTRQGLRKKLRFLSVLSIVEGVLLFLLLGAIVGIWYAQQFSLENASTLEEVSIEVVEECVDVEEEIETEVITTEVYYETVGKKICFSYGFLGQIWVPVLTDVTACEYELSLLITRNGLQYYVADAEIHSVLGVDVSSYQGSIDWYQVKESGIDFAMIRVGYRGYGTGTLNIDTAFYTNIEGALAAGLDVGVYFYSQALDAEEAIEEAELVLHLIDSYDITYPVVYDWEIVTSDTARTDDILVDNLTACTKAFCDTIKDAGYTPMVYQNKVTSYLKLDLSELTEYDFWLAEYNDTPSFYYRYDIWQYCSDGSVPGIDGEVDLNIAFTNYGK